MEGLWQVYWPYVKYPVIWQVRFSEQKYTCRGWSINDEIGWKQVEQERVILCRPKSHLSPGFVDKYGDGIRKIQTPVVGLHRQSQTLRLRKGF